MVAAANRFALFAEDEELSPVVQPAPTFNPFVNQVAESDTPWQEVKRGSQACKAAPKTLVIRNVETKSPSIRSQQKIRDFSGSTQDSDSMRFGDPHEYWCGVCQHRFPNKNALLMHIKQSPQRHENYCNLCKRVFKDRNGLKNHVDNAGGHEIFCNLCLSAFINAWGLKNHFENNYSVIGHDFACLTCLLGFRTQAELDKHLSTGDKHVWCHTCHRKFKNQTERDEHWRLTTKHRHCLQPGCDFDALNDNVLEKHLRQDHFQCEGCRCIFPSQTKLNSHQETCTFDIKCPKCGHRCAGQVKLAFHMESCFRCAECHFLTSHEGNFQIHMTKHAAAFIPCWRCDLPLRKCSSLLNHLESGNCLNLPDPTQLLLCIRSKRIDVREAFKWMKEGLLQPFICRAPGCGKTFKHFSSLVLHVESQACEWDLETLRLDLVQAEFSRMFARKDSAIA